MVEAAALELVRAGPDDAGAVRDLVRVAYARWVPIVGREPTPMTVDYAKAVVEHEIELLVEDGALIALIETYRAPGHLYVENIAIAPERQGRGLGRRLLAHAEAKARESGLTELRLLTNARMEANIRLYRSHGYVIEREEPFSLGGTTVHMSKRLAPAMASSP
jgi:ribosomal protein S18 acetylase RimI-like enzyme